jgi:predicted ATPase
MITRLYADNYKTLVNFELRLGAMNLLLGANGSGKSNVLEVIRLIRKFICEDETVLSLFPTNSLCRWETRNVQTFEIDLRDDEGTYWYKLEIEHEPEHEKCRVKSESLFYNQSPLFTWEADREGELYHDGSRALLTLPTASFRSSIGAIASARDDYTLLSRFRKRLERAWSLRVNPDKMAAKSGKESIYPNEDMSNFAAWYRHLALDRPNLVSALTEVLKTEVLEGFRSLRLKSAGEKSRALFAEFAVQTNGDMPEKTVGYRFGELSDGQRTLIALYALAICALDEENTLCLDHPESYLALPEIQPWLLRLAEATEEGRCQAIIATHHPELINLLAANAGYWLERQSGGPTRVRRIGEQDTSGLPLSELIARGWLHG